MPIRDFPSQGQLFFPLLEEVDRAGGKASPKEVADALAVRFDLDPETRERRVHVGDGKEVNDWDRHVRWVRQRAVLRGMIGTETRGVWQLTEKAKGKLQNVRPGILVVVFETPYGMALWAEAEHALGYIDDESLDLVFTSPPYDLNKKKEYGNLKGDSYLDWMTDLAYAWKEKLHDEGSLVINLGDAWISGSPTMSAYQERLLIRLLDDVGFHLAQRFYWENPSKLPSPAEWVTIQRIRVTPSVEQIYWLSKTERPKADNRKVLRAYSERMKKLLAKGGQNKQARPSGHVISEGAFSADNGGSIPHNCLMIPNTRSNDLYTRMCKANNLPVHPARFPEELPEFFVKMLTDEGDIVYDPFGGSGVTAIVCERLKRHWLTSEKSLSYLQGNPFRFLAEKMDVSYHYSPVQLAF